MGSGVRKLGAFEVLAVASVGLRGLARKRSHVVDAAASQQSPEIWLGYPILWRKLPPHEIGFKISVTGECC